MFFNVIGAPGRSRILVSEYIRPRPGDRILEIGCGPGTIVPFLPTTEYVGFDASPEYIKQARNRFPRAKFVCERVSQFTLPERNYFDIVLALGILHHLQAQEALQLFRIAHDALKPGGRLVTLDGVWTADQSRAARYIQTRAMTIAHPTSRNRSMLSEVPNPVSTFLGQLHPAGCDPTAVLLICHSPRLYAEPATRDEARIR